MPPPTAEHNLRRAGVRAARIPVTTVFIEDSSRLVLLSSARLQHVPSNRRDFARHSFERARQDCGSVQAADSQLPAAGEASELDVCYNTDMAVSPAGMARKLSSMCAGLDVAVIEASDGVGGRVRTDELDGFLLDRGFQIFLTGYPAAQAELDYEALDLKPFYAGALVHFEGTLHRCGVVFLALAIGYACVFLLLRSACVLQ